MTEFYYNSNTLRLSWSFPCVLLIDNIDCLLFVIEKSLKRCVKTRMKIVNNFSVDNSTVGIYIKMLGPGGKILYLLPISTNLKFKKFALCL